MNRHAIVGHFGTADRQGILPRVDELVTHLDLLEGEASVGLGIGAVIRQMGDAGLASNEIAIDLLVLAGLVYAADTRISRVQESQDSWTREIRIVVPVSDVERWERSQRTLETMLDFLTGDRWIVEFRPRPERLQRLSRPISGNLIPRFSSACLFSGGLDSLIGAIDLIEQGQRPVFVSHYSEGAASSAQTELFDIIKAKYPNVPLTRLRLRMVLPSGTVEGVWSEDSTRGRSFLFFALGVLAASGIGHGVDLIVPENGFIALNVPLDALRLGSNSTRTTHPFYIARWNELVQLLGLTCVIQNPYRSKTKGQMILDCMNDALLREAVTSSMSCSAPTKHRWDGYPIIHCGYCLPCIIRKAALNMAWGEGGDPTQYFLPDLSAQELSAGDAKGRQIRSFQVLLERVTRTPSLVSLLIHKPGSLRDVPNELVELAEVYRRGLSEVGTLLDGVVTNPG